MEDSFKARVDRIFGSLSSSTSQNLSSLWSLTDDEIERKEWNREKAEPEPEPEPEPNTFFANLGDNKQDGGFRAEEKDILDLDDDLDDEEAQARDSRGSLSLSAKGDDYNDEEWEIKCNIGLDCTLDNEEEEDQYDKVAVGKEMAGDRLYMKDINDYKTEADSFYELPNSFKEVTRDPRANHNTAKIRLKEDAEAAKKIYSLLVSEKDSPSDKNAQADRCENGNLKPILKRGDTELDSRLQKRVRFDPECKDNLERKVDSEEKSVGDIAMVSNEAFPSGIPDYMRNPSKYTCYTLDSEDVDDKSNRLAYMDFLNMLKKSKTTESQMEDDSPDLPKTVTFIPRRITGDATMAENDIKSKQSQDDISKDSVHRKGLSVSIAFGDENNDEVCAMEEDEAAAAATKLSGSQRSSRRYRMREKSDME